MKQSSKIVTESLKKEQKEAPLKIYEAPEFEVYMMEEELENIVVLSCLASGTKILMADGSLKNIEDIKVGDMVKTFNHETGLLTENAIHFVYKGESPECAFTLHFSNGAELSVVGEHAFFVKESMKYETITEKNAEEFIGKHFYSMDSKSFVQLENVVFETEKTDYYEIYASETLNCVANGMLNVADDVAYALNLYSFDENLKADGKQLEKDILENGLLEYSETYGYSEAEFSSWNVRYIKIMVGKGLISLDGILSKSKEFWSLR